MENWKLSEKQGISELYRRIQSWITLEQPTMKEKKLFVQNTVFYQNWQMKYVKRARILERWRTKFWKVEYCH
ncbi:hypothetical protein [Emticicia aquatica]|uniref:hypothetical protein n=1 Tax=Emticicia aquatica TaxID=1681835 RepID=UPI001EEA55A6|nr:hypothetical protein [Emticicia aquatica]